MSIAKKIRVLVVDDSATARKFVTEMLSRDPEIEVVGTANDPYMARDKILELNPDVLTLDVEMPRMDGISFLRILQKHRPIPAVILSSTTHSGSINAVNALAAGAVDILAKPTGPRSIAELEAQLAIRVKGAAAARRPAKLFDATPKAPLAARSNYDRRQIILMGASTGGVEALTYVLQQLPAGLPGICVVQHIPPIFSRTFAERVNQTSLVRVHEAADGDEVLPGTCLIAPGDFHMRLTARDGRYFVKLDQAPVINFTRPAVDALFLSAVPCAGANSVSVLLTGMGRDGADGMRALHQAGGRTLAQNAESCVVHGMPKAAVQLGAVDREVPLDAMPQAILHELERRPRSSAPGPALKTSGAPTIIHR